MKIDMNEVTHVLNQLKSQRDNIDKELERAKKASDKIVESNALSGKVKEAIDAEINNHKIPLIEAYRDTNKEIVQEFKRVQNEFEKYVEESSNTAVIDTDALHDIARRLSLSERKLQETNREISRTLNSVRDIVSVSAPSFQNVEREYHATKKKLADIESKMDGFSGSYFKKVKISISSQNKKASEMGGVVKEGFKSKRILKIYEDESFRKNMIETSRTMQMDIIKYWTDSASEIFSNCKNIESILGVPKKIRDELSKKIDKCSSNSGKYFDKNCKDKKLGKKVFLNEKESKRKLEKFLKNSNEFRHKPFKSIGSFSKRIKHKKEFARINSFLVFLNKKADNAEALSETFKNWVKEHKKIRKAKNFVRRVLKKTYCVYKVSCDIQKFMNNPFKKNSLEKDLSKLKKMNVNSSKNTSIKIGGNVKKIKHKKTGENCVKINRFKGKFNKVHLWLEQNKKFNKNVHEFLIDMSSIIETPFNKDNSDILKKYSNKIDKYIKNPKHIHARNAVKRLGGFKGDITEKSNYVNKCIKESSGKFKSFLRRSKRLRTILGKTNRALDKTKAFIPGTKTVSKVRKVLSETKTFVKNIPAIGEGVKVASTVWSVGSAFFDKNNKKTYHNFGNSVIHAGIDSLRDVGPADLAFQLGFLGASLGPFGMAMGIAVGFGVGLLNKSKTFKKLYNGAENALEH